MTPLHRAVLGDDLIKLSDPSFREQYGSMPDALGFTPLEIARFLGKYEAVKLLGGNVPSVFLLQPNGIKNPVELSLAGFEKAVGIHYRSFLTFPSYLFLKEVIQQCPYILRSSTLVRENYELTNKFRTELTEGKTIPIVIKWIGPEIGYGAFADQEIPAGTFVGEYTGIVRRLSREHPDHNPYCFHYPTKLWSWDYMTIDSMREGNLTRFINHSRMPNLQPLCLVDRRLLHLVFISSRRINGGEQLTFDYGDDYWMKRNMKNLS